MGYKVIEFQVPTGYENREITDRIGKMLKMRDFSWQIDHKSLDARKKGHIFWSLRVVVTSDGLPGEPYTENSKLDIPYRHRNQRVIITGSGPAGFFAALVLQKAGFDTLILERGMEVKERASGIAAFEKDGIFRPEANYAFGEGGAGTFSDGKLTSRSKHISKERRFFLETYIAAGAPEEIRYMAYPHVGSDNLRVVVKRLRELYRQEGGEIHFHTTVSDLVIKGGKVLELIAGDETFRADHFIMAPGHSAYETYRMLMGRGVGFRTKNFAIGCRAEHPQEAINQAQWGSARLPGVKAAEYRLTSEGDGTHPVYSFCMCPGGVVVPAATYPHLNIVNGMSRYQRNGKFANAGCVVGVHPDQVAGRKVTPAEALEWLEVLENRFFRFTGGYQAPFCSIRDFLEGRESRVIPETSYPLGLKPAPLWQLLPEIVVNAMRAGLRDFDRRLRGYSDGILLGLESKTSSPVQVLRTEGGRCEGFDNLFFVGEGSGYAGGIVSSAADGIRGAMELISRTPGYAPRC